MKKNLIISALCLCLFTGYAQNVGINPGGTTPNSSSILDLNTGNTFTSPNGKGLIVPNVALTGTGDVTTVAAAFTSLLVYNTATAGVTPTNVVPGFYYWDGAKWVAFMGTGGKDWSLTGNAGTTVGTNFLGTTDNVDLQFNVNNARAGLINIAQSQTFFGNGAGLNTTAAGTLNSFFGTNAGLTNAGGSANTAFGYSALKNNSTAGDNTMFGVDAGYYLNASYNTSVGMWSLEGSSTVASNTGVANTALGFCAGGGYNGALGAGTNNYLQTTSGSYNTFLGYSTAMSAGTFSNTTTVGAFAQVNASDAIILGGVAGTNGCTNSPKVGIGTSTPIALLHLSFSSTDLSCQLSQGLRMTNSSTTDGTYSNIKFASFDLGGTNVYGGQIGTIITSHAIGGVNGEMYFHTTINTGSYERMRITSAGNVGIGTSTPETSLHLVTETTVANPRCLLVQYDATNTNSAFIVMRKTRGTYLAPSVIVNGDQIGTILSEAYDGTANIRTGAFVKFVSNGVVAAGSIPTDLTFGTGSSGVGLEWMRITSAGLIGIGTSAPTQALHVVGNICYTGGIGACSDMRYKKDFTPLTNTLAKVLKINGLNYYWKQNEFPEQRFTADKQIGFIAQDLEKIYPELVTTDANGYKSVDYSRLTPIIVEAMKEQQLIIDSQKTELQLLKERLDALEKKMAVQPVITASVK